MTRIRCILTGAACLMMTACSQFPNLPFTSGSATMTPTESPFQADKACRTTASALKAYELPGNLDLWDRIRAGFAFPEQGERQSIQQELEWYAGHPHHMVRVAERGQPYLYHIVQELDKRNMPMEFALLPIVESAFDPFAYSHGRASGLWQFIPSTGEWLGLEQNWWYDGRRDITAATDAALRYLKRLGERFEGNWMLALAAYNAGPGNVSQAIRHNKARGKPINFWSLDLPSETEAYVPRLLALKNLIAKPEKFDLSLKPIPNQPFFTAVDVGSQIDLAQAAELAGMSMEEFYRLNPAYNRWATDPEAPHKLLVPVAKADSFRAKLAAMPTNQRITWERYRIQAGDTLSTIAARYKTRVSALKTINGLHSSTIRKGDVLLVPVATQEKSHYAFSVAQRLKKTRAYSAANADGHKVAYEVQAGDSFWEISRLYEVSVRDLAEWNGMAPGDPLHIGQKLVLWTEEPGVPNGGASSGIVRKVAYEVRQGDSLWDIANRFRVSVQEIQRWNQINPAHYLQPGQALTLFVDVTGF